METGDVYHFEGHEIIFDFRGQRGHLINATQMLAAFPDKKMNNFLRNGQTRTFIAALEDRYAKSHIGPARRKVLDIVKGGAARGGDTVDQGTWMDEILAIKFAGWLSAPFEIWMYERVREILLTGRSSVVPVPVGHDVIGALRGVITRLEQQESFNDVVSTDIDYLRDRVDTVEAKLTSSADAYFSVAGYCKLHDLVCTSAQAKAWGREAAALSRKRQLPIGTMKDGRWGSVGTYHELVLREVCV